MSKTKFVSAVLCAFVGFSLSFAVQAKEKPIRKNSDFALLATSEKSDYKPLEPVILLAEVKNMRTIDTPYWSGSPFKVFHLHATGPDGKAASVTEYGKQKMLSPQVGSNFGYKIKPGDAVSASFTMNRLFDMTLEGQYKFFVEIDLPRKDGKKIGTKLVSETVTVKVKE